MINLVKTVSNIFPRKKIIFKLGSKITKNTVIKGLDLYHDTSSNIDTSLKLRVDVKAKSVIVRDMELFQSRPAYAAITDD